MHILKKVLLSLVISLLTTSLFLIAFTYGFRDIAGDPQNIKQILNDSGIYKSLIPNVLSNSEQSGPDNGVPLTDPLVKSAAEKTFSPEFVKTNTEKVIDGMYAWLEGDSPQPTFQLDLTSAKASFIDNVVAAAEGRAAGLPRCARGQVTADFNAFSAECLPAGVTPKAAGDRVRSQLSGSQEFLGDTTITADSLKGGQTGRPVFEELDKLPAAYQQAKKAPFYLATLAILAALAVVWLSPTKRRGVRRVGISLVFAGLVMLLFGWLVDNTLLQRALQNLEINSSVLHEDITRLLSDIARAVAGDYKLFGGVYTALGAAMIAAAIFIGRPKHPSQPQPDKPKSDKSSAQAKNTGVISAPAVSVKPKPRTIKIQ